MSAITIDISPEAYERLAVQARKTRKAPETLGRELLETALKVYSEPSSGTVRDVLQKAGLVRSLGESLRRKIISGVSLDEVRQTLTQASDPSLSEIVLAQRGPKP